MDFQIPDLPPLQINLDKLPQAQFELLVHNAALSNVIIELLLSKLYGEEKARSAELNEQVNSRYKHYFDITQAYFLAKFGD